MKPLIWGKTKAEYFFAREWTAKISLKWLRKFRFWCEGLGGIFEPLDTAKRDCLARRPAKSAGRGIQSLGDLQRVTYRLLLVYDCAYAEPAMGRAHETDHHVLWLKRLNGSRNRRLDRGSLRGVVGIPSRRS
jgi:hypothetical protein